MSNSFNLTYSALSPGIIGNFWYFLVFELKKFNAFEFSNLSSLTRSEVEKIPLFNFGFFVLFAYEIDCFSMNLVESKP